MLAAQGEGGAKATSEAFDELVTPPMTPVLAPIDTDLGLKKGEVAKMSFERPFYEMIVDGIHSHPNSVRVSVICSSRIQSGTQISPARVFCVSRGLYLDHRR